MQKIQSQLPKNPNYRGFRLSKRYCIETVYDPSNLDRSVDIRLL
jgi:hypothetical protein